MKPPVDYFDSESLRADLGKKTVRGGLTVASAQLVSVAVNLAAIPVLSRLLDKEDFGLIALVTVFTSFASLLSDAGLTMATVQRKTLTHQQASNLFWVSVALGATVMLGVAAMAPLLAWFYEEPRLLPVTAALSVNFLFNGVMIQPRALLRRAMQHHRLAIPQIAWAVVQLGVMIAWAWGRRGEPDAYWALVAGPVVATVVFMLLVVWLCGWLPSRPRRGSGVREVLSFGAFLSGASLINQIAYNADAAILGAVAGLGDLGAYDRAKRLLLYPVRSINGPLAGVIVPSLSRSLDTPSTYRSLFSGAASLIMFLVTPIATLALTCPDWLVRVAFGPGWELAVGLLRLLSPAMLLAPLCGGAPWLFTSQGRAKELLGWQVLDGVTRVLFVSIGVFSLGVVGAAAATSVRYCFITPVLYAGLGRRGPFGFADFFRVLLVSLLAMAAAAAAVLLARATLLPGAAPLNGLLVAAPVALVGSSAVFAADRSLRDQVLTAMRLAMPKRSAPRHETPAKT